MATRCIHFQIISCPCSLNSCLPNVTVSFKILTIWAQLNFFKLKKFTELYFVQKLWGPVTSDHFGPHWNYNYADYWKSGLIRHSCKLFSIFTEFIHSESTWASFSVLCHFQQQEKIQAVKFYSKYQIFRTLSNFTRRTTDKIWSIKGILEYIVIYLWSITDTLLVMKRMSWINWTH